MIKNKLYPYIEKYINEYLYGFNKEKMNVGVMNGQVVLDGLNIKPDKVNEQLDTFDIPIWLKAGMIKKIRICCSLMNLIGEKPLEVFIDDIDLLVAPSFKWIFKNMPTFIEENEIHLKEPYDSLDNNAHDIFNKKVNIYDSSVIKQKQKLFEIFTDQSKIAEILNKIFTKCLKFYYQKPYLINLKIKNVHLRFEDDHLINYYSDIALGLKISNLEINLSADGVTKKNNFKCENLNVYWEPNPRMLISTKTFTTSLDKDNKISQVYYNYVKTIKFVENKSTSEFLIHNFNFMGNFGINVVESGNLDFFSVKREKKLKFYIQAATSELNLNVYPELIQIAEKIVDFMKSFFIVEAVQDFKPMRKPYNKLSEILKKFKTENVNNNASTVFAHKRKMVIRDWMYYLVWFHRFKKAIYGNVFKNPLHTEFSKYFNICCLPNEIEAGNKLNASLNDSIQCKKNEGLNGSILETLKNTNIEDPNPEKINLVIFSEVLIKGINLNIYSKLEHNKQSKNFLSITMTGIENKSFISKDKFEFLFDIKSLNVNCMGVNKLVVSKHLDDKIREEISGSAGISDFARYASHGSSNSILGNNRITNKNVNDALNFDNYSINMHEEINPNNNSIMSSTNSTDILNNNPKLNKKLYVLNETLDQIAFGKKSENVKPSNNSIHYNNSIYNNNNTIYNNSVYNNNNTDYANNFKISNDLGKSKGLINNYNNNNNNYNSNNYNNSNNNNNNNNLNKSINNKPKANFIDILLADDKHPYLNPITEEKTNKINLSKMINEYNKNIKQKIVAPLHKDSSNSKIASVSNFFNEKSNTYTKSNLQEDDKIDLYFLEISPINKISSSNSNPTATCVMNLKFTKANTSSYSKTIEALAFNFGSIRANLPDDYLKTLLLIASDYAVMAGLKSKMENEKNKLKEWLNLKNQKKLYEIKNLIFSKLNYVNNVNKITINPIFSGTGITSPLSSEIIIYKNYIKKELEKYDKRFIENENFEINYIFNILNKQNLEINLNFSEVHLIFYNSALGNATHMSSLMGKFKFPNLNFKFAFQSDLRNFFIKIFDFEFNFSDSEKFRLILNNLAQMVEDKFKFNWMAIEPVIKKLLEEKKSATAALDNGNIKNKSNPNIFHVITNKMASSSSISNMPKLNNNNNASGVHNNNNNIKNLPTGKFNNANENLNDTDNDSGFIIKSEDMKQIYNATPSSNLDNDKINFFKNKEGNDLDIPPIMPPTAKSGKKKKVKKSDSKKANKTENKNKLNDENTGKINFENNNEINIENNNDVTKHYTETAQNDGEVSSHNTGGVNNELSMNTFENISELEDLGFMLEKPKQLITQIKPNSSKTENIKNIKNPTKGGKKIKKI